MARGIVHNLLLNEGLEIRCVSWLDQKNKPDHPTYRGRSEMSGDLAGAFDA